MYIPMLEAISDMLILKNNDQSIDAERVACAKIMLDKIIEGMHREHTRLVNVTEVIESKPPIQNPPQKSSPEKPKHNPDDVGIEVNNGFITKIINAKDDTMIQLDGKAYPWKKTIGMSFTEGKVL